jgi:hypothetical protein
MRAFRENYHKKENCRRKKTVKQDRFGRVILSVQMQSAQRIGAIANGGRSRESETF